MVHEISEVNQTRLKEFNNVVCILMHTLILIVMSFMLTKIADGVFGM